MTEHINIYTKTRQTDRQTETERDRETETETDRQIERERQSSRQVGMH